MRKIFCLLLVFILTSCGDTHKPGKRGLAVKGATNKAFIKYTIEKPVIQYSDQQLESFLDSIGHLPALPLASKVTFGADSILKNQLQLDTTISSADFNKLKLAARKGVIAVNTARRIFGNNKIDSSCNEKNVSLTYKPGLIPIIYYPFNKDKKAFDEYAICIGDPEHCENAYLYFLKGKTILARHSGYNRNGLNLNYNIDETNKTVVHYAVEFDRGSGIWWYQFLFYKYDGMKLIPVLNIPENVNLIQPSPWGFREVWLESFIQKTNPLTVKMVYHQQLPDTVEYDHFITNPNLGPMIVNDSTFVKYSWNGQTKSLQGDYEQSKITQQQVFSYYLSDNELLFINAYNKKLRLFLLDKTKRKSTLHYLNKIKNSYNRK